MIQIWQNYKELKTGSDSFEVLRKVTYSTGLPTSSVQDVRNIKLGKDFCATGDLTSSTITKYPNMFWHKTETHVSFNKI